MKNISGLPLRRSSRPKVFCKKGVPRNFAEFTRKHLSNKCFPVNFAKFLRTSFLQNTSDDCFCLRLSSNDFAFHQTSFHDKTGSRNRHLFKDLISLKSAFVLTVMNEIKKICRLNLSLPGNEPTLMLICFRVIL